MIKITLIIINIVLTLFLYFLNQWFSTEEIKINNINQRYIKDTRKLQEIKKIDNWLVKKVKSRLLHTPNSVEVADLHLIEFFDRFATNYNFKVKKFIYHDQNAHYISINYTIARNDYSKLVNFMKLHYKDGYKVIDNFVLNKTTLEGELILVQPFLTKIKKQEHIDEIVPQ